MALDRINEFVKHLADQPNSADGFSAKVFYETGMTFGLTCREICDNFLGKDRALARGKYPATLPDNLVASRKPAAPKAPKPVKAAAKKVAKTAKAEPAAKKATGKKGAAKKADQPVSEVTVSPDPESTGAVFEYIATPDEIAGE